jgi:hypothetical protein
MMMARGSNRTNGRQWLSQQGMQWIYEPRDHDKQFIWKINVLVVKMI